MTQLSAKRPIQGCLSEGLSWIRDAPFLVCLSILLHVPMSGHAALDRQCSECSGAKERRCPAAESREAPSVEDGGKVRPEAPAKATPGVTGDHIAESTQRRPGFAAILIDSSEPRFSGDPISLTLKDADVKDVLRTFAELSGLNIVVHPDVRGSVTVELRNVPWDQALDIILRINGLAYELEGSILYVAPAGRLGRG